MVYIYICVVNIYLCIRIGCVYHMNDTYIYMCTPTQQHEHVYKLYSVCKDSLRVCTHLVDSIYTCFVEYIYGLYIYIYGLCIYIYKPTYLCVQIVYGVATLSRID